MLFFGGREATTGNASAVRRLLNDGLVVFFHVLNILIPYMNTVNHLCKSIRAIYTSVQLLVGAPITMQ